MNSLIMPASAAITLALVFYTIGVFGERRAGTLKKSHLALFWLGLICDTTGTTIMTAIARTLTRKTPILVFDDSLSAVDAQTDVLIRTRLRERMKDSTVILISHRITTLMEADQIMVMDKGHVTQLGTHEELMKQENGMYRRIYDLQMSLKEEEDA